MSKCIAIESFLRDIYPLEYALMEDITPVDAATEGLIDIKSKLAAAIKKLSEWIKKIIKMVKDGVMRVIGRFKKPPKIVGKERSEKPANEEWVAPEQLMIPDTLQNAVRKALKRIELLTGQGHTIKLYEVPKYISEIAKDTAVMFDDHNYDPDDKSSNDELAVRILSVWRYVNACGPEDTDSDVHEAKTVLSDAMDQLDISTAHFVELDKGFQATIDKYFNMYSKLIETTKPTIHDIEKYYSDAELNKYFQRLYTKDEVSETYINDKITMVHSNISKCTSTLNRLLGVCSSVLGILEQCVGIINKYSR